MEIRKIEKKKTRIALLVDAWFPLYGGGQVHAAEVAKYLIGEHGYKVDIITRAIKGRMSHFEKEMVHAEGLKVMELGIKSRFGNPFMRLWYMISAFSVLILAHFFGEKYDLYHSHAVSSAVPMKLASWITGVPTAMTVHGTIIFKKGFSVKKLIERITLLETRYSREITVAENFLKAPNVNKNVAVIPNGISLGVFDAVRDQKTDTTFDALFVGRLEHIKGLDVLLESVKKVVESNEFIQSHKDFLLHIVGEGAEQKSLEKTCERLEITKYVKFHGKVSGEPLIELYKSCDLFVLPSRSEGFPLTLLEACAAKLPILATNVGDNSKLVIEKVNGHLVAPEDVEELAYYLEYFATNPGLKEMGEKGYELVKNEYSWQKVAAKTAEIYTELLKNSNAERRIDTMRILSIFHDARMPWFLPRILVERKLYKESYKGRSPLKFCFTVDCEQSYGSADLPHEIDHIPVFLGRLGEMAESLEMKSTVFVQGDLLEIFKDNLCELENKGHEIGIHGLHHELWSHEKWFLKDVCAPIAERKKSVKKIWENIAASGLKAVRAFRAPNLLIDVASQRILKESGFEIDSSSAVMLGKKPLPQMKDGLCKVPVSRDPMPHIRWKFCLPFGNYVVMNMYNFLKLPDHELLGAIDRLREYHRRNRIAPHLVFLCHSWEFQSRDGMDYPSGENFTELSKKLAMLKAHMDLEFMTLTELCTSLYANN